MTWNTRTRTRQQDERRSWRRDIAPPPMDRFERAVRDGLSKQRLAQRFGITVNEARKLRAKVLSA